MTIHHQMIKQPEHWITGIASDKYMNNMKNFYLINKGMYLMYYRREKNGDLATEIKNPADATKELP